MKSGIGFDGLLAMVFITLKLTGVIAWSWWWVLSPLWIPLLLVLALLLFMITVYIIPGILCIFWEGKRNEKS